MCTLHTTWPRPWWPPVRQAPRSLGHNRDTPGVGHTCQRHQGRFRQRRHSRRLAGRRSDSWGQSCWCSGKCGCWTWCCRCRPCCWGRSWHISLRRSEHRMGEKLWDCVYMFVSCLYAKYILNYQCQFSFIYIQNILFSAKWFQLFDDRSTSKTVFNPMVWNLRNYVQTVNGTFVYLHPGIKESGNLMLIQIGPWVLVLQEPQRPKVTQFVVLQINSNQFENLQHQVKTRVL